MREADDDTLLRRVILHLCKQLTCVLVCAHQSLLLVNSCLKYPSPHPNAKFALYMTGRYQWR